MTGESTHSLIAPDQQERQRAVDPAYSCIVQAPAGSGKTTLLVDRYLNLLTLANKPEEILAITFTKKAAAEMRHRILARLGEDTPLARTVCAREEKLAWRLLDNPQRLKVQTIDSFALELASRAPGVNLSSQVKIVEAADVYYRAAAQQLFAQLNTPSPSAPLIAEFLAFLDNDADRAQRLITQMLGRRDQWLAPVTEIAAKYSNEPNSDQLQQVLASAVGSLRRMHEENLQAALHDTDMQFIQAIATALGTTSDLDTIVPVLLTKSGTLRKRLTRRDGIEDSELTREINQWLTDLRARDLVHLFEIYAQLPTQHTEPQATEHLYLCCVCLALAVIELEKIFSQQQLIDFTGLLIHAKLALHDGIGPTDLALVLDYQINHILIDEYQDTSRAQQAFFTLLTSGWQKDDSNSFFCVGDPMQSIYRFRDADVSIFTETQNRGLATKPLQRITLRANFRSDASLVQWCNESFTALCPTLDNPYLGQITYSAAQAMHNPSVGDPPSFGQQCLYYDNANAENQALLHQIKDCLAQDATASIAILCRARRHILPILNLLDTTDIQYLATDMRLLEQALIIKDLMSLYRILLDPSEQLAWFSILRSPMFGLQLPELTQLKLSGVFPDTLTSDTPALKRLMTAWHWGRAHLHEVPLREVIEGTWLRCGGWDAYTEIEHSQALTWFRLIEEMGSDAYIPEQLVSTLTRLFSTSDQSSRVQVMTIHKSKGLEFDHVFVPFLDRPANSDNASLLSWRPHEDGILMGLRGDSIHGWLKYEDKQRSLNEEIRLLYVACTRAKRSLWLSFSANNKLDNKIKVSGLAQYLTEFAQPGSARVNSPTNLVTTTAQELSGQTDLFGTNPLTRLAYDFVWTPPAYDPIPTTHALDSKAQDLIGARLEVAVGNLVHRGLAWIAERQDSRDSWENHINRWAAQLDTSVSHVEQVVALATQHIRRTLADPTGQWLLLHRIDAHCELALSGITLAAASGTSAAATQTVEHIVIDRTFVDQGARWIIDYKTATPPAGNDVHAFVRSQTQHYHAQLRRYHRIAQAVFDQDINLALYFTAISTLQTVEI